MVNTAIVERLLHSIQGYVAELRSATDIDRPTFGGDVRAQRFVERTLQIAVEACLDVTRQSASLHVLGHGSEVRCFG